MHIKEPTSNETTDNDVVTEAVDDARATLEHVEVIAQTATDRAAAADRRATTIAGATAIAASFTLSGAGVVLDRQQLRDDALREIAAIALCGTAFAFALAGTLALVSLVVARTWSWPDPHGFPIDKGEAASKWLGMRATHLLESFALNWEVSDQKNRIVDHALKALVLGLAGVVVTSVIIAIYVL